MGSYECKRLEYISKQDGGAQRNNLAYTLIGHLPQWYKRIVTLKVTTSNQRSSVCTSNDLDEATSYVRFRFDRPQSTPSESAGLEEVFDTDGTTHV